MSFRASLLASVSVVAFTNTVTAGPQGGNVVSGAAVISTPGPQALTVTQTSRNAIINWQGFSVGAGESASFLTPTGGATLNRVTGADPSSIYGSLTSTGRLFLINPNGIVVGPTGVIDTAGLVLSTHSVKDAQFLAGGDMTFSGDSNASVVNRGTIRSTGGGDVFLIARHVENAGSISAPGGTVGLAGGTEILIRATDAADGRIAVRKGPGSVKNAGDIAAAAAELRAAGGNHYALAVNNTGVVRATGVKTQGGRVFLTANTGKVSSSGKVSARNADGSGGKVRIATAPRPAATARRAAAVQNTVDISGTVDVSAENGAGGSVVIEAEAINIASSARIDASGPAGGGFIAIGGGFQGKDVTILNADDVTVAEGAQVVADAKDKGDGGKVSIWADGATTFHGAISARGGASGGDGGFAEVSGKETVTVSGHADLRAPLGAFGTLLIDPGAITIQDGANAAIDANTFSDGWIEAQLGGGTLTIQTATAAGGGTENITVKSGVSINWNGQTRLVLMAGNDIIVENNVVISNTQTGNGSTTFVQKDAGGVQLLAGRNISIGEGSKGGAIQIGSEFGYTLLAAGDTDFNGGPNAPGVGNITIAAGALENSHVQIGYRQPAERGANTGHDYAAPGIHAQNGTIHVLAGGEITLTGGSNNGSFAQIGHGGWTTTNTAEILRSDINVISSGGSVKLDSLGVESGYARIGHGSYLAGYASDLALGPISGDIHVNALTSVVLNGAPTPPDMVKENGVADVFLARIGHGSHAALADASVLVTGDIAGAITIGAKDGAALAPATPLKLVQLGSAISPTAKDDVREVFSQIGHGTDVRIIAATDAGGTTSIRTGGVRSFADRNRFATNQPDVTIKSDEVVINSMIASPLNALANVQRGSIGNGNYVRLQAGAPVNESVLDGSVVVAGVNALLDGLTLSQALANDLSNLTASEKAALDALAAAHTTLEAKATASATRTPFDISLSEGDITGNVLVSTNAGTGKGVALNSVITAADIAVTKNTALARIGHGGFIQLTTPGGMAGAPGLNNAPATAPARGGSINFIEANVLYSTIRVETNNKDDVTANASVAAGLAAVSNNVLGASIGSGNEAFLITGAGGTGIGVTNVSALPGAHGGDILYRRGTVWDGNYPSAASVTGDDGYDTTVTIVSQNNIKLATSATAALATAAENVVVGRVGHGALISLSTGAGGDGGSAGSNGGRGGDVRVVQQTPGRDYGITGSADDLAWGLRGQIALQASDLTSTPALEITSSTTAAVEPAQRNTISSRVGHGDQIIARTGQGAAGAARTDDTFVTTAHGGRGGHVDIDLSRRLIESRISGLIEGEVKVSASATNVTLASSKNLSEGSIGHGESIEARSGTGGSGGSGQYLTNATTVANSQAAAETFLAFGVFGEASGSGAARGGNSGDISIRFGTIAERRGPVNGLIHDADANIELTITGANPTRRSLTVSSLIAPGVANGHDQVTANIGHNTRLIALSGQGAQGGSGRASFDAGFVGGETLDATTPRPVQNDASGGRGGDVRVIAGAHDSSGAPLGAAGAPANTLVIGRIIINADEQVAVTSNAGPGSNSRAHSGIGHLNDAVALTSRGQLGGLLLGTSGLNFISGANDGVLDSDQPIQVIVNRDGSRGVSLAKNGVADTIQSVAARRTAAPVNGSTANPSFFDVDGNPEFILDAGNNLVPNVGANLALRSAANNVARFGRVVGTYSPFNNMERVQYVDVNNDGSPDVVAAVLGSASRLTLIDADNNNVYDKIAGRVRLTDFNLLPLGLVDYVYATGRTANVAADRLDWTYADFSTANGGRGGDASVRTGLVRNDLGADPLITINAGRVNSGAPASNPDFSLVVSSVMQATPPSAGPGNVASARIGVADYLYASADSTYNDKLAGALFAPPGGGASGGGGRSNAVNANGGRGGDASVNAGAVSGSIAINPDAPLTRGVKVSSFTDDVTSANRSIAAIGHGGQYFATAANTAGQGQSNTALSSINESADGGRGGAGSIVVGTREGGVNVRAGSAEAGGDFAIVIEAIKGASTAVSDSDDITFATIGHGGLYVATGGRGGQGQDGQYMANGGAGGAATIDVALTSGGIELNSLTYADSAFGNGVRIEASTSEGSTQKLRAQAGHFGWATATGGAGGVGSPESEIVEQFNQQANGGAGGAAQINHAGFAGGVTISAGAAKSGDNAILIKSSDNTVNSLADNYILATAGHGAWADATGGAGGLSGRRDALGGLTFAADPAFHQGFDIANPLSTSAPLDRNPIMFGTVRNGGAGGAGSVTIGGTTGTIGLIAHDVASAGGKDGILVTALAGDGANMGSALFGNVAMVGHNHNAKATGGAGGDSISRTLAATVTSGNGGDGGSGSVTFGGISGDIGVTNVIVGEANATGGALDKNIRIFASDQDATDNANHRVTARVGHRTMADAFGGAGGNAALPPPGPLYNATLSAQGGFGGAANITSGAITGAISLTAENSVLIDALNPTVSSPTVVAGAGHHAIANAVVAGEGGFGGASASFNDAAMLTALRRYVDLGQNYFALSELEKQLVAPVLHYYRVGPVFSGEAGPAGGLPGGFIARILAGPRAFVLGTTYDWPLARDNDAIAGAANSIPAVSAEERDALVALSMASGHGGRAFVSQGQITGDVTISAISADRSDAARGFQLKTVGVLNAGTQIAHVGHENEVSKATGGKGQNVRGGTIANGIGGDGGAVFIEQAALQGTLAITAGSTPAATAGDILVSSSGTLTSGWQRSLIGHRQTIGSDDPGFRTQPVVRAGDGGGDRDAIAQGKLGNGGSVAITQANVSGALNMTALGKSPSGDSIKVISSATTASGETLSSIGHAFVVDSVKAGDATPYTVGPDARASLYGVREGNGGSISIAQGSTSDPITLDANDKLHIESVTAAAPGRATTLIGHKQIVADNVYGTRGGTVVAGNGADVLNVEDIDVATDASGFLNAIHANHVQDADGGNVVLDQGSINTNILLQSRRDDVSVLANGSTGETTTYVGNQRFTTALTGQGGVTGGPAAPRSPGEGGTALITRGALAGNIDIVSPTTATVKTTSALGSDAAVLVGHTTKFDITTGRSGYGANALSILDGALAAYLALRAPTDGAGAPGEATARDAARVIQHLENVVAAITIANRYAEHYSPAQKTDLAKALADATTALANARASTTHGGVAAAVTAGKAALKLAHDTVEAGGNLIGIADAADSGAIVYTNRGPVSGDISVRGAVVAVQAEGGDGKTSLVELGHRHSIVNTTGAGAGLTVGGPLDAGVAGDSGSIVVTQITSGNVELVGDRVVVNPTSGVGAADVHLSHKVDLVNTTGKADIEGMLGRGGAITSSQESTGEVLLQAGEFSSDPKGAADGLLMADGGPGASRLRIGVEASAKHLSDSDEMIAGLGGPDNNRGGHIDAAQTVSSKVTLARAATDLIIRSVGLSEKLVRIGALATQTARSGDAVDDGSNVTASQTVTGDITARSIEDLVVENIGPGASTVHIGHTALQVADSGETAGLTPQHGGITKADQSVGGSIGLTTTRTFTQQTDGVGSGFNQIGHSGSQTARSADQRTAASPADYPIVPGAPAGNFNVVSTQTVRADVSVSSGEILIRSLNGAADGAGATEGGVRLGNTAEIIVDTHNLGRVQSTQTLGGNVGLTTLAPAAQRDPLVATAVNGDIRVLTPAKPGTVNVGHESTSTVSHNPAAFQPTGVFVTSQRIVDNINVTAVRNVEVRDGEAGTARIGHTIVETSALSTTNAVKTSAADPSTVTQLIDSTINVTAGNSLAMVTTGGMAQIGHFSPASNEWQVTGGRVVTPQTISGAINVYVGLNTTPTVVGEAPAVGALGTNNALLDGTAGGEVRIGHKFAPVTGAAANEVQVASGDIWVEVGAHLHVKTANIGHGPYDFASVAVSKENAVTGAGAVRNRIAGLTTIGASQNTPAPQDATTEADIMLFDGANVNSGYGENGGQLRFFIPSRRNLTITDTSPTQFNDSTSQSDAIPARTDSPDKIVGAVTHENGFLEMSTTARYDEIGAGNFAFYFADPVTPAYVVTPLDALHRIEGLGGSCIATAQGGVNAGAVNAGRRGLAWALPHSAGGSNEGDGPGCGQGGVQNQGFSFVPAPQPQPVDGARRGALLPPPSLIVPGPRADQQGQIVIRTASPAPVITPPAIASVPLNAVRVSGGRILSFATSGTNLVATISSR